jgi:hypothetical protein
MIMSLYSTYPTHSFPQNWSALDLADAVPLRLSERITLGLVEFAPAHDAANNPFALPSSSRDWRRRGYVGSPELSSFRVR